MVTTHQCVLASSPSRHPPVYEGIGGHGELQEACVCTRLVRAGHFRCTSIPKASHVLVTKCSRPTAKPRNKTRPVSDSKVRIPQQHHWPSHLPHLLWSSASFWSFLPEGSPSPPFQTWATGAGGLPRGTRPDPAGRALPVPPLESSGPHEWDAGSHEWDAATRVGRGFTQMGCSHTSGTRVHAG